MLAPLLFINTSAVDTQREKRSEILVWECDNDSVNPPFRCSGCQEANSSKLHRSERATTLAWCHCNNQILIQVMLIGNAAGLFCSPCTAVIARRAGEGSRRLVILQCNGGTHPWGNQGRPPSLVRPDSIVQAERGQRNSALLL